MLKYIENFISGLTDKEKETIKEYDIFSLNAFRVFDIEGLDEFIKSYDEINGVRDDNYAFNKPIGYGQATISLPDNIDFKSAGMPTFKMGETKRVWADTSALYYYRKP